MNIPTATYRIQFRNGMTFDRAAALVPYLKQLGISHLYASPIFSATAESTHGYDVTDVNQIEPSIGGRAGFDRMAAALKAAGRNDVIVVGIDGSNDERDAVKAGTLKATVMLQAQAIAAQGVTDLDNYIQKGAKPEKQRVMFRGILITPNNAKGVQDFNFKS